ncbi:L,D-transpeptidase family protein [Clostridium rectalis]|uniref:L,D-transpeptidase family protein n=1 Tax=Clostridium rectalis TaxID=2040295 RepID=UPI000F636C92|nr:L,D-transpeptidase [Clostridium rectalis]
MFKKRNSFMAIILLLSFICFYTSFKISYSIFIKDSDYESKNNFTTSTDKLLSGKIKKPSKESNKITRKELATSKKTKQQAKSKVKYTKEDYIKILKELNFYTNEFSDKELNLRKSILRFQSSRNINADGIIGPETVDYLIKRETLAKDTLPNNFTNDYSIVINKDTRILTVYKDKKIYKKYPIAAGFNPSSTPEGKFTIATKIVNPTWINPKNNTSIAGGTPENPLGKRWLGLSLDGGGTYGIHGNSNPYSIGTNASLGCVRMFNNEVEDLYNYIPIGTSVWIGNNIKLNCWGIIQNK